MRFRPNARLDPSQVEDVRGSGGFRLPGGGLPSAAAGSACSAGHLPRHPAALERERAARSGTSTARPSQASRRARSLGRLPTGADANTREDCRIVGYVNSIQALLVEGARRSYTPRRPSSSPARRRPAAARRPPTSDRSTARSTSTSTSTSASSTSCARASARAAGPFAQAYVLAHEYGHHVQDLLGTLGSARASRARTARSVQTELQADCYAGVWAHHATQTGYIDDLTQADINDALTPPPPSATTGSRRRRRATSIRRPGRTALGASASTGSRSAGKPASRTAATPSPPESRQTRRARYAFVFVRFPHTAIWHHTAERLRERS